MEKDLIMNALFDLSEKFIKDNYITCAEMIHQTDHVIENAYEFIEEICELVGYFQYVEKS